MEKSALSLALMEHLPQSLIRLLVTRKEKCSWIQREPKSTVYLQLIPNVVIFLRCLSQHSFLMPILTGIARRAKKVKREALKWNWKKIILFFQNNKSYEVARFSAHKRDTPKNVNLLAAILRILHVSFLPLLRNLLKSVTWRVRMKLAARDPELFLTLYNASTEITTPTAEWSLNISHLSTDQTPNVKVNL